jgi:tetratricopeptide (TPR) repeat protein
MNRLRAVLPGLLLLCAVAVLNPPAGDACGPFFPVVSFVYEHEPGPEFVRGELGIVKPGYYRRHLVVAYRYLSGAPLTPGEAKTLQPRESIQVEAYPGAWTQGSGHWLKARAAVPDVPKLDRIEVFANRIHGTMYFAFQNCLDDAFESAVATLSQRIARWGANSPLVAEWLRGQDLVFSNCTEGSKWGTSPKSGDPDPFPSHIPSQLPVGTDPTLLADRNYQIAAAQFYSGHYHAAAEAFSAIAADAHSPWQSFGAYLAARSLLRAGTVDDDKPALLAAEKAFRAIVADPKQSRFRDSASGLLDYARAHLDPEDRMAELGDVLTKPGPGPAFGAALTDFTMLWDRVQHGPATRSDLADWITTLEAGNASHALERWRNGGGTPWLVAAIGTAHSLDADTQTLLVAARQLRPADPAYASAAYYGVRLDRAAGQLDEARAWADEALAAKLPLSAKNDLLHLRTLLACDWTEFLRFAPRLPVVDETGEAGLAPPEQPASKSARTREPEPTFDADALDAFNRIIPLSLWIDATANPFLPKRLQAAVTDSAWVRAVLLGREAEARALAGTLARVRPELAVALRAYAAQPSAAGARFDAVFLLLHTPGLSPLLHSGYGRLMAAAKIDSFRDNWWEFGPPNLSSPFSLLRVPNGVTDSVPQIFLSSAQRAAGEREWAALAERAAVATNFLCAETLAWAKPHPGDPRLPEALYLAVRATRYGPADKSTRDYSRRSFELLHRRFPNSEYARKTKYWY